MQRYWLDLPKVMAIWFPLWCALSCLARARTSQLDQFSLQRTTKAKGIENCDLINGLAFSERSLQQLQLGYFSSKWGEVVGCHIYDISLQRQFYRQVQKVHLCKWFHPLLSQAFFKMPEIAQTQNEPLKASVYIEAKN